MKAIRIDGDTIPLPKPSTDMMHVIIDGCEYGVDGLYVVEVPRMHQRSIESQLYESGEFEHCEECMELRHKNALRKGIDTDKDDNYTLYEYYLCKNGCNKESDSSTPFPALENVIEKIEREAV